MASRHEADAAHAARGGSHGRDQATGSQSPTRDDLQVPETEASEDGRAPLAQATAVEGKAGEEVLISRLLERLLLRVW